MAGVAINQFLMARVVNSVVISHKSSITQQVDRASVQAATRFVRRARPVDNRAESRLQVGHDEGRRHALPRNVCDGEAETPLPEIEEIVEVSAHRPGRLPVNGEAPAGDRRHASREQVPLDFQGPLQVEGLGPEFLPFQSPGHETGRLPDEVQILLFETRGECFPRDRQETGHPLLHPESRQGVQPFRPRAVGLLLRQA